MNASNHAKHARASLTYALSCVLLFGCASSGPGFRSSDVTGEIEFVVPEGWNAGGTASRDYRVGVDRETHVEGDRSATLYSTTASGRAFGTLAQSFEAGPYRGERVRFRARLRCQGLEGWAGLWFRVDSQQRQAVVLDNMHDRALRGTLDWTEYETVIEVPDDARVLHIGLILQQRGQVWMDDAVVEIVGDDVATTARRQDGIPRQPDSRRPWSSPRNLGFERMSGDR